MQLVNEWIINEINVAAETGNIELCDAWALIIASLPKEQQDIINEATA